MNQAYLDVREASLHFMHVLSDVVELYEYEADSADCPGRLDAPGLVERVQWARPIQTEGVSFELCQEVFPTRSTVSTFIVV